MPLNKQAKPKQTFPYFLFDFSLLSLSSSSSSSCLLESNVDK